MAPSAINVDSSAIAALPNEVSKAPPGVVLPPRDIRAIVEKTAGYVARNGAVFEDRIREKEKHNPKFSFLSANDAYNPFYAWRLNEIKEGRGSAVSAGRVGEAAVAPEPEKPKGPRAPPEFHFSARMPNISAQDLDVVKLTALFVAKNGRSFMTTLSQKETRNYQFDFLRPQHSLYQFFSRLVDQYTLLLQAASAEGAKAQKMRIEELENNVKDRFNILDAAKTRAAWVKFQEEQKQKKEEEAEKEKLDYAQIDWHDFVVVETVLFEDADNQADLPPPPSLNDLQSASLEQKAAMSLQPHDRRIEEAMPTSEDYGLFYNQQQQQMPPPSTVPSYPTYDMAESMDYQPSHQPPGGAGNTEEDRAIAERAETRERAQAAQAAAKGGAGQPMRIRNDYVPRAQAKRQNVAMAVCPNCNQQIPYDELEQHMRIELLDPRWKEQRLKSDQRQSTTNLSTSDVAANLKRLASQRSDVFDGVTGQPVISEEEAARRKKAALNYDGQLEKGKEMERRQGMNIDEQIRQIHQKFNQSG
ncbi:MAG: hypothetical protein LQ346_001794 [Caloplaca aetnensis]|nr:MAG: hypothetical protein LQ346_001794 [Caloplaca aetnensis]